MELPWLLLPFYFLCIALMLTETIFVFRDFINAPIVTSVTVRETEEMDFPNITVCIPKWLNQTRMKELNISNTFMEYLKTGFMDITNYRRKLDNSEKLHQEQELDEYLIRTNRSYIDYIDLFNDLSTSHTKIIASCTWQGVRVDEKCISLFDPYLTDSGLCFKTGKRPLIQRIAGVIGGLKFVTDNENFGVEPDVVDHGSFERGVQVHVTGEWVPTLASAPIMIPSGYRAFIQVRVTRMSRIHSCVSNASLSLFDGYSREGCLYECFVRANAERCGCFLFAYGIKAPRESFCTPKVLTECTEPLAANLSSVYRTCSASCAPNCESTKTESTISYSLNDPAKIALYNKRWNRSWNPNETTTTYVYLSEIGYTHVMENESMTWHTLVSNIGGQLGLWLGVSFISLSSFITNYLSTRFQAKESGKSDTM